MGSMKGMNMMMYIMPLFSVWFAFVVPAGVGFYWICSSFFSLIQTIGLNLYFTPERSKVIAEKEQAKAKEKAQKLAAAGKKTFAQRLAEVQGENPDLAAHAAAADKETAGMSRKEVSKHNREKLNEVRKELAEKYGDQVAEAEEYDDSGDSEELKAARKRMAEKYGDKY
jgi:YidC/Oxa1 family membrane protein insertase